MNSTKQITVAQMTNIPAVEISDVSVGKKPLVSVIMLAYNHETYIREAVVSIVSQKADFEFELLIGEDASTDDTLSICKELQQQNPHIIRLITSEENVGMHKNFARLWCRAKGDYIAFCEGDDYWIDQEKISKQAKFLMDNSSCSLCATYTQSIQQDAQGSWLNQEIVKPQTIQKNYTLLELIPRYNFHFSSVMVRRDKIVFPSWFWNVYCVDRPLYLLAAEQGDAGLIPEITSVYRHHMGGSWFPLDLLKKAHKSIHLFGYMRDYFPSEYDAMFDQTLGNILFSYLTKAMNSGQLPVARAIFIKSLQFKQIRSLADFRSIISVFIFLYVKPIMP